jgi:hypothetical protein
MRKENAIGINDIRSNGMEQIKSDRGMTGISNMAFEIMTWTT